MFFLHHCFVVFKIEVLYMFGEIHVLCAKSLSHVWLFVTSWTTQPARLLHPWDSPDKNTGVGCHFLGKFIPSYYYFKWLRMVLCFKILLSTYSLVVYVRYNWFLYFYFVSCSLVLCISFAKSNSFILIACLLFSFPVLLCWLKLPVLCWITMVEVDFFALFLVLWKKHSVFHY